MNLLPKSCQKTWAHPRPTGSPGLIFTGLSRRDIMKGCVRLLEPGAGSIESGFWRRDNPQMKE